MNIKAIQSEFTFEAVGFIETRKQLQHVEKLELPAEPQLLRQLGVLGPKLGITGVTAVYLSEDDAQGDTEIKVFVVAKLTGTEELSKACSGGWSLDLQEALDILAQNVCGSPGAQPFFTPESWELSDSSALF